MADQVEHPPVMEFPPLLKSEPKEERPSSPETNCAICLEEFNNKSYTNSCFHEFCYHCLKEWSKIKPECPLCKQRFQTIIYNIRSQQEYDEYHVENSAELEVVSQWFSQTFQRPLFRYRNTLNFRRLLIDEREFFFMPAATAGPSPPTMPDPLQASTTYGVVEPPVFEHDFSSTLTLNGTRNRRDVYRHDRWVRPSVSSRIRESNPLFYRWNPAQTHRLYSWLSRELNVLLDVSVDPHLLCQEILNLITTFPIRSRQFRNALRSTLGDRVEHFIHEFYHFAISPHEMVTYDMVAEYGAPGLQSEFNFSNSSDSDSDIEVVTITGTPVIKNVMSFGQVLRGTCLDLTNRAGPSNATTLMDPNVVIEISDTDTSDSEIEIIEVPTVEPQPQVIVIDSSCDEEQNDLEVPLSQVIKSENISGNSSGSQSEALAALRNLYHTVSDSDVDIGVDENSLSCTSNPKVHSLILSSPTMSYVSSDSTEYRPRDSSVSSSSSSSSSRYSDSTVSDSNSSECDNRKKIKNKKRRKKSLSNLRHSRDQKRLKRVSSRDKSPISSSDEDYPSTSNVGRSSCRLKSVVIKPTDRKHS